MKNKTSGINTISFDLGDGTTSSNDSLTHAYKTKGIYSVILEAKNAFGCKNNISKQVNVSTKANAAISISNKEGCAPFVLDIKNNSSGDDISFQWIINGQSYTIPEIPNITLDSITKDSNFIIQLSVSNTCGTVLTRDSVLVHPYPIVNFGVKELQGCSPFNVIFSNISVGNPTQYTWDMGNGVIINDFKPANQTYITPKDSVSLYSILLTGSNSCGIDSVRKSIIVYPPDVKAFIQSPGFTLCQYDSLKLEAFSTKGAVNTWKIISPDGTQLGASGNRSVIRVNQSGKYTVILYASGCGTDTDTIFVNVHPAPLVDFNTPLFGCAGIKIKFENKSLNVAGSFWEFGDGLTSNATNGEHPYINPGNYKVKLTAYSLINNCPFSIEKLIKITGIPSASFKPSFVSGCEPLEINFQNLSSGGNKYEWSFADSSSNSIESSPTHLFKNSGTFPVKLTVFDDYGCFADTSILNIIVYPKAKSSFIFDEKKYCLRYDTIRITNLSVSSTGQLWTIGKDSFNTKNLLWVPSDSGDFVIKLNTFSTFGCKDSTSKTIKILPSSKSLFISDKMSGCEDLKISFSNSSTHADKFVWDFDNGTKVVNRDPVYTFTTAGTFNVKLIAINNNGCPNDTFIKQVNVYSLPDANFSLSKDAECGIPLTLYLNNLSSGNVDNNWLINGNLVSKEPNYTHKFNSSGKFSIQLIVQSENLCMDTIIKSIDVFEKPLAAFEIKLNVCEGETLTLKNNSKNAIQYEWDIQGKGKITKPEPEISFEKSGSYNIQLIAILNQFCKDTVSTLIPVRIFDQPKADFNYTTGFDEKVIGEVLFKNTSQNYTNSFWDFGDGFSTPEANPTHEYNVNRDINVKLIAYNVNGGAFTCTDSISKSIAPEWITTFYTPTALSPEYGEGDVKVFKPVGEGLLKYEISIFSPWGEKVWQSDKLYENAPSESWDGTYKGSIVPQGAYSWMADITFLSGLRKVFKGSVTVLR
ncbi:MAG: PKD domain-containing protein [Saprospiraceae bacterium]